MKIIQALFIGLLKMTVFLLSVPFLILGTLLMMGGDNRLLEFMWQSKTKNWVDPDL